LETVERPAPPPTIPDRGPVAPSVLDPVEAPTDMDVLTRANLLGCDCPLPPPADIDPDYLPQGVETWLDDLERRCGTLDGRAISLDCSEWPCMLTVEIEDREETMRDDLTNHLTCGDTDGPQLVHQGSIGSSYDDIHHVFVVRPADVLEYRQREFVRMANLNGPRVE
jgi:hypothetical protein